MHTLQASYKYYICLWLQHLDYYLSRQRHVCTKVYLQKNNPRPLVANNHQQTKWVNVTLEINTQTTEIQLQNTDAFLCRSNIL